MDTNLIIDIDNLPEEGLHFSRSFDFLSAELVEENAVFLEPVHADVFIRLVGDDIYVQGALRTRLSLVCSRCLTPFEYPIASRFDLVYLPEEMDAVSEELSDEDIDLMFYRGRRFDIKALVLEQLNLTLPARPLCSPDCEGICSVCGEVIRNGQCSCTVKESDPRWEKLKLLVKDKI